LRVRSTHRFRCRGPASAICKQVPALAANHVEMKDRDRWLPERIAPLLAGCQDSLQAT